MHDVLVVGAGLAGLSCAYELSEAGVDVLVLDANDEPGGVVGTDRIASEEGQSFLFERGPNTVQASSRSFRELCGRLGIADRLVASADEAKRRYLFFDGALRELPRGPASFLRSKLLTGRAKRRLASEPFRRFRPAAPGTPEPTLLEFFEERLGPEAAAKFAGAFVRGIYAAELSELGIRSAFPRVHELCVQHGGLVRGMIGLRREAKRNPEPPAPGPDVRRTALLSFPEGLCEFPRALATKLGDKLRSGTRVQALERSGAGWAAKSDKGQAFEAQRIVLAVPAPVAAKLLEPHAPSCGEDLQAVSHGRLTLIHQGFTPGSLPDPLPPGFGFLVPPADSKAGGVNLRLLGTIFGSNCFAGRAPEGGATTTQFYRTRDLPPAPGLLESTQSAPGQNPTSEERSLLQTAHSELKTVLGQDFPEASVWRIQRWDDVIPRYAPGHADRIRSVRQRLAQVAPKLSLIGNYTDGVSVENVIRSGLDEAARTLQGEVCA